MCSLELLSGIYPDAHSPRSLFTKLLAEANKGGLSHLTAFMTTSSETPCSASGPLTAAPLTAASHAALDSPSTLHNSSGPADSVTA